MMRAGERYHGIADTTNQLQVVSCIYVVICFKVTQKTKIDIVENQFCVKIPVFP